MGHCSLILIGLALAAPLLQNALLCTDDSALHVYRTVALDRALRAGLWYPRWFPDLAYGYGLPFFNYREPLGYYLIELVHLFGASIPAALNWVLVGSLISAGLAMNLWVGDVLDRPAGFVAGVVYMAAPYTLIDALVRANLPEAIALALMPLVLWAFRRLLIHGGRKYLAFAVLSLAALLLTHNISSLIFAPFLMVYCVICAAYHSSRLRAKPPHGAPYALRFTFRALRPALLALLLALALTAFFWLPALSEGQAAQLYLTYSARGNDYHFNFATVAEVLGPPGSSDPLLLNPPLRLILGWPQMVLAVLGVIFVRRLTLHEQRAHVIFAALAAMFFIAMALPGSLPLWEALPLIRFVQFPWRFIGRAVLPMSLLAGTATYALFHSSPLSAKPPRGTHHALRIALLLLFTLTALLSAAPLLYPHVCPGNPDPNMIDLFAYEHATGHVGVDPLGAYLPVTVVERPDGSPLEAQYAANESIKRLDRSALPEGAQVLSEIYRPNDAEIGIDSPAAFQAAYLTFAFPGWQVSLDGQSIPIVPSQPYGLITFEVPAGRHHIEVWFGDTPVRTAAKVFSLAALGVLGVALVRGLSRRTHAAQSHERLRTAPVNSTADQAKPDQPGSGFILHPSSFILVPIVFLLIKMVLIDPQLTPLRQTHLQDSALSGVEHPLQIDFGDQLRLLGYNLTPDSSPAGARVRLDLYWRALRPLDKNYQTTVGVVDEQGEVWSPKTLDRPRDYQDYPATYTWSPNAYVVDSFDLPIVPGAPSGGYSIFAEVFERGSLQPLPAQVAATRPQSRPAAAIIGPIAVTRAARTFTADELGIYNVGFDQALTPEIKLLGANWERSEVLSGETVLLTLFWQATQKPLHADAATIELVDDRDRAVLKQDDPLGGGHYPTSQWDTNEQVVDLDRVRVPANLPDGRYHWRVSIGSSEPLELGALRVTAPQRSFEAPTLANRIDQTLGNQATLLGFEKTGCTTQPYSGASQDVECRVTLVWRAEEDMPKSYKVFVQLLDANGALRAQADTVPVNGTRPTWSWLPGEVLTDEVVLKIPADLPVGTYRLTTGLYAELDGKRLTLPDGKDAIDLTKIEIAP